MKLAVGQVWEKDTPFIKGTRTDVPEDGAFEAVNWHPGVRYVPCAPDDFTSEWDGLGAEIRSIVAIVSVDRGPPRVLYRKHWRRPDGGEFGRRRVCMTTPSGFGAWRSGSSSRHHDHCFRATLRKTENGV